MAFAVTEKGTTMSNITREEAIQVLQTALTSPFIYGEYADAIEMAIHALHQPPNEDWERYADHIWKEAYERGKQDVRKGGDDE